MNNSRLLPFIILFSFSAIAGSTIGFSYYQYGKISFTERKTEEKTAVLKLISAFVSTYSQHRVKDEKYEMPVPATFRAQALKSFNAAQEGKSATEVDMVGVPGLEIANISKDPQSSEVIKRMADDQSVTI